MLENWRQRRAAQRIKPGTGGPLKPYRWYQWLSRALYYLTVTASPAENDDGEKVTYAVDVDYWDYLLGTAKGHLYLDGKHHAWSRLPAAFPVPGGHIQVKMAPMGLKRCHYVTKGGTEYQLTPDPHSAEGHRARLEQRRPRLSRAIGALSLIILVLALVLGIPQLVEQLTSWDFVEPVTGSFTSPVQLPEWLNGALIFSALAASIERALRMRYNWLLDGGGDVDF